MNLEQSPTNQVSNPENPETEEPTQDAQNEATEQDVQSAAAQAAGAQPPKEEAAVETPAAPPAEETPTSAELPVTNDTVEMPVTANAPQEAPSEPAPVEATKADSSAEEVEETTSETPASEEAAARPRVKLNPTVDPAQARAIPSPALSDSPPAGGAPVAEGEESAAVAEAAAAQSAPAAPPTPSGPVEIPPAIEDIDAEMEAELAAAMSGEQATAPPAPVAGETGEPVSEEDIEAGTKLKGRVQSIQKESILLDVGFRSSAMVPLRQFEGRKQPQLGQELEVVIDRYDADDGLLLASLPRAARSAGNWDEVSLGQVVECLVKKSNKGGLEVTVSNLRAFMPASQVDLGFVSSLDEFIGQKLTAKVIELKPEKRNLVVSRRAYLQDEREEVAKDLWKALEVGQTRNGKVKTLKDYGAFVDIGGIDGLLHVAEMAWTRVNHPRDILKEGEDIDVQIISIDQDKKKISLSLKKLKRNPWDDCVERYPVESVVRGRVSNITDFGAFVEIEEGVEGLIHISELDYRRVNKVTDVLSQGEEVEAKVVSIDSDRKRIGLSLKALKAKPEPAQKPKDEDLAPGGGEKYQRKRKGPLKGGTGSGGGPLFG